MKLIAILCLLLGLNALNAAAPPPETTPERSLQIALKRLREVSQRQEQGQIPESLRKKLEDLRLRNAQRPKPHGIWN